MAPWACCSRRRGEKAEGSDADAGPAPEEPPTLQLSAFEVSRRGQHQRVSAGAAVEGPSATWDAQALRLLPLGAKTNGGATAAVEWRDVSGVWTSLRAKEGIDLSLEVGLETWSGEVDYVRLWGPIDEASGRFLDFLQAAKSEKLKEGRAPGFVMSRWAAVFYRNGISSNRLRVALGWTSIVFEVMFAICFFSQIQRIMLSRESKLLQELHAISSDLGRFQGLGTAMVLMQHFIVFLVILRSMFSTLHAALRSLQTFHRATKKAQKSLRKLSSKAQSQSLTTAPSTSLAGAPGEVGESRSSSGGTGEGGDLRQRRRAE